jgi:hypothetical protein
MVLYGLGFYMAKNTKRINLTISAKHLIGYKETLIYGVMKTRLYSRSKWYKLEFSIIY